MTKKRKVGIYINYENRTKKANEHTTAVTPFITSFSESGTRRLPVEEETQALKTNLIPRAMQFSSFSYPTLLPLNSISPRILY